MSSFSASPLLYGKTLMSLWSGLINVANDPMYMMLLTNAYTPNQDVHQYLADVSYAEIAAPGYIAGGQQVTGLLMSYTGATKQMTLTGGNLIWPSANWQSPNAPAYAAFYMQVIGMTNPEQQPLVGYMDFGGTQVVTNQSFYIDWPATGVCTMTVPSS